MFDRTIPIAAVWLDSFIENSLAPNDATILRIAEPLAPLEVKYSLPPELVAAVRREENGGPDSGLVKRRVIDKYETLGQVGAEFAAVFHEV